MCKSSNLDTTRVEQSTSYFYAKTLFKLGRTEEAQIIMQNDSLSILFSRIQNKMDREDAKKNGLKDQKLTDFQKSIISYKAACGKLDSSSEYPSIIQGAIAEFNRVIFLNPDLTGPAFEKIGDCCMILKLYELALDVYQKSLGITSLQDDTSHYNNISNIHSDKINVKIAQCLAKMKRPDEAITKYNELIETDPNTISHYLNKAKLLISTDIKSAIDTCKKAIGLNPQSHKAHNLLSNMYNQDANYKKALKSSESSLKIKETGEGYAQYARSFSELGNTKIAIEKINKALEINQDKSDWLILKAEIYLKKADENLIFNSKAPDDYREALAAFTKANEINETLYSSLEIIKLVKYSKNPEEINENLLKHLTGINDILSRTKPSTENKELKNCIFSIKELYEIK